MNKLLKVYKFYKGSFIKILIYELFYSIVDKFKFSIEPDGEKGLIPPIPTPYYYLFLAKQHIKKNKINYLIDIGSGTGRALNFFSSIKNIKLLGIEISKFSYEYSVRNTSNNIKYINDFFDINKLDLADCYFLADSIRDLEFKNLIKKIKELSKRNNKNLFLFYINGFHFEDLMNDKDINCIFNNYNSYSRGIAIFSIKVYE